MLSFDLAVALTGRLAAAAADLFSSKKFLLPDPLLLPLLPCLVIPCELLCDSILLPDATPELDPDVVRLSCGL